MNRQNLIDSMTAKGLTISEAHMVCDVSIHAAQSAMETLIRAAETLPGEHVQLLAMISALVHVKHQVTETLNDFPAIVAAVHKYAQEAGE